MTTQFIRVIIALAAFTGWIVYQLVVKKKIVKEIRTDIFAIIFFGGAWLTIYYLFIK